MRSYTVCKTSILAWYQAYIRPILDGEVISSVTTGHSRHRTTATQYCFHFNISYGITFLSRDCSLNQADVFIISAFIQRTLRIDISEDRKSTRLNSSHVATSYAVFCLQK